MNAKGEEKNAADAMQQFFENPNCKLGKGGAPDLWFDKPRNYWEIVMIPFGGVLIWLACDLAGWVRRRKYVHK